MRQLHRRHSSRPSRRAVASVVVLATGFATVVAPASAADDIDLLRTDGGKPYVYFIVDTSGSMVLDENGDWVPGNGDDPASKIYQVKKALYDVLKDVDGVHFGFAGFNQDRLAITAKHWLYTSAGAAVLDPDLTYPTDAGKTWTFGKHINTNGQAGTCASPLSLTNALDTINRFPRLGTAGLSTTTLWVSGKGNKEFQVLVSLSPASTGQLGDPTILVRLQANAVTSCSPLTVTAGTPVDVSFRRVRDFLMVESNGTSTGGSGNCNADETLTGLWPYTDVLADNTCGSGSSQPFTGEGWEGNTDDAARTGYDDLDKCCVKTSNPGVCQTDPKPNDVCYDLRFPTVVSPVAAELDKGDEIPFNWSADYQTEFLKRLNPKYPDGEDFGIASYFQNLPDSVTGLLQLKNQDQRPLVAFGNSPLGRAINDFRCWYLGKGNKCKGPAFDPGWERLFELNDRDYACRVPYLILVSDGEDNSQGEAPAADTANLFSMAGVRTFAFSFSDTKNLHPIVQNGRGELILVQNGQELEQKLRDVIGNIVETAKTFASAAVPSVQAAVADKIYLTNFTPLDGTGNWDGHLHSYLKPLPIDPLTLLPDTSSPRHLWDAGEVMLEQAPDPVPAGDDTSTVPLQVGNGIDERRVYYSMEPRPNDADARGLAGQPAPLRPHDHGARQDRADHPDRARLLERNGHRLRRLRPGLGEGRPRGRQHGRRENPDREDLPLGETG